ncbi:hypothetical protein GCM10027592_63160 [Spirosoma flavus]
MAFSKGNQLWSLRRHSGRKAKFQTAEELLSAAESYFEWCDANPLTKVDFRGNPVAKVVLRVPRPYTFSGLCVYLDLNSTYWRQMRAAKAGSESFAQVIDRIESIIWVQKFEGAAVGLFNANIISRSLKVE